MITTDLVWFDYSDGRRGTLNADGSPMRCSLAEKHRTTYPSGLIESIVPAETCLCCGSIKVVVELPAGTGWRCERHRNSVPCAVEGCRRTWTRDKCSETICAQHWRAGVPPGSEARRVWNRFRRVVRRFGWTPEREARGDRLWEWLKRRCQAAADGDLDQREIDRLFGWAE